jgi:hypothetical protein
MARLVLTFERGPNEAIMRDIGHESARFLGYLQLQVGTQTYALPVQATPLNRPDGTSLPGGFFVEGTGKLGILVDSAASADEMQRQIQAASLDAVRHISRRFLN